MLRPPIRRQLPHDWPARRRAVLARDPFCSCGRPTTEAHHLKRRPPDAGRNVVPEDALELLVGLCRECHSRITAKQVGWAQSGRGGRLWW